MTLTVEQAAAVVKGQLSTPCSEAITGAAIDSRQIQAGHLFVAIKGDHVDGHHYLAAARELGAVVALVSEQQADDLPQIIVDDVVVAFGQLAAFWREQHACQIIAVTGSNGKTTVKEMLAAVLSQHHAVIATKGNLNNHLGVPLTLFRIQADTEFAVIEMGANHPGDIAYLVGMAKPNVALINNVGPAHIEGFGSLEGVAKAKGEIFSQLADNGVGITNADMPYQSVWQTYLSNKKKVTFGLSDKADITATDCQSHVTASHFMVEIDGVFHYVNLPLPGEHNISNALAAIAGSQALGITADDIISGLATIQATPHRLHIRAGLQQSTLIDDSYNANPASYQKAIATLKSFPGEHWIVLGDFGEMGHAVDVIHKELGIQAKSAGIDRLLTIGEHSRLASEAFGEGATHYDDMSSLGEDLKTQLSKNVTCLIKGSRFMQLDQLADQLTKEEND